tara:strand:+ start:595 stop:1146 length:552 start_codon:yes stop_codon:yes gene_type:complete
MRKLFSIYILFFFFTSCGFYSLSGSLPLHIKTISIPMVENETAEFGIAESLSDGIQNRFNDEGILKIVNKNSDSILRGTIKEITDGPYTFNKNESISEYRYKIDVYIEWYDEIKNKTLLKGNYSGWGAYGLSGDIGTDGIDNDNDGKIDSEDDNEFGEPRIFAAQVATKKIAEDIINDIMTIW